MWVTGAYKNIYIYIYRQILYALEEVCICLSMHVQVDPHICTPLSTNVDRANSQRCVSEDMGTSLWEGAHAVPSAG